MLKLFMKTARLVPLIAALTLLGAAAHAATYTYRLLDHPDGSASKSDPFASYGLRLDRLDPDSYWSFENGGYATMTIKDGGGGVGAGEMLISGKMRQSFGTGSSPVFGDLWTVDYLITGLTVGADGTFIDTGGSGLGTIISDVTNTSYALGSKANGAGQFFLFQADGHRVSRSDELIGRGWVDDEDNRPGANDFLFRVAEVPLPAAGWLLLAGLGGLTAMRRRRKA